MKLQKKQQHINMNQNFSLRFKQLPHNLNQLILKSMSLFKQKLIIKIMMMLK